MDPMMFDQLLQIVNLGLVPLALVYGAHKGWITTGRELRGLEQRYAELQMRYDKMESRLQEQQDKLREELEETRDMLIQFLAENNRPVA
jgi:hypothetical protein